MYAVTFFLNDKSLLAAVSTFLRIPGSGRLLKYVPMS